MRNAILLVVALSLAACVASPARRSGLDQRTTAAEPSAPLAGDALDERKRRMRRAHADLIHFHVTLESLARRDERRSLNQLTRFIDGYLGVHVEPLLRNQGQDRHPELMALDANLRCIQAGVLIRMRETGRAQHVLDELEHRYRGREDMLVDYPVGRQSSLREALRMLRDGKWRG